MLLESDSRYARADSITAHRRALRTADFDPLPDDGKECFLVGWSSKTAVSDTEIRSWQSSPSLTASSNTGILTKFAPALDIDILDQHAADAVEELIRPRLNGMVLVRTGLPPQAVNSVPHR